MTIPQVNDGIPVGTIPDMTGRLRSTLPTGWFPVSPPVPAPSATPVLDGLLVGLATAWSYCFGLLDLTATQTRVATATGGFLDMMSVDFFGAQLPRQAGETDGAFRSRIEASLISQHGTRQDLGQAVQTLTALKPLIFEPNRASDCGGYGDLQQAGVGGGFGYCTPGLRYGSNAMAFQYLVNVAPCVAFAPGKITTRESPATYVDGQGLIQVAPPRTLRPDYQQGACVGPLVETRAFNLITDSRFATGFTQSAEGVDWWLDYSAPGLFGSDPVISMVSPEGSRVPGPSIDLAAADSMVAGSAWIFLGEKSSLTVVELCMTDLNAAGSSVYVAADMSQLGQWQRLSTCLQTRAAAGRNLRLTLLLSGPGDSNATASTQCWQAEPGQTTTSYIPTSGTLGIRAEDDVLVLNAAAVPTVFVSSDVQQAITRTIPAATIAWTVLSPDYDETSSSQQL